MTEYEGLETEYHFNEESDFLGAYIEMQAELEPLVPDRDNPFTESRYRTHAGWLKVVKPILTNHSFALLTTVKHTSDFVVVYSRLYYRNGEYMAATSKVRPTQLSKANATQMAGASQSYLQRYHLLALLNVAAANDDDESLMSEDGINERESQRKHNERQKQDQKNKPSQESKPNQTNKPSGNKTDPERQKVIDEISKIVQGPEFTESEKYRSTIKALIVNTPTVEGLRGVLKDVEKERDRREAENEKAAKQEEII